MQELKHGILIATEGIDGSGKTSLTKNLTHLLNKNHFPTIQTQQPGGTTLGKELRHILQTQTIPLCSKAEYLLFAADRAQHMHEVVNPALEEKKIVISDRMGDSSIIYQGYGRGLEIPVIYSINMWAMNNRQPNLVLYIKIDLQTAYDRLAKRGKEATAFEAQKELMENVIIAYEKMYANAPHVITIDGQQDETMLAQNAFEKVYAWMQQKNYIV